MISISFPGARRALAAILLCGAAAGLAQLPGSASVPPPGAALAPNDPAERLSGYLRTLAGDPANVVALNGAGRAALEIGDVNGALGFYGRAAQASPQNGNAKAGLAAALVQLEQPRRALPLFAQAVQLGVPVAAIAADRGLAYDLIGDGASAQRDYAVALAANDTDETRRRYALSLGIGGDRGKALDLLDPLVRRRDPAGWRARAFVMALTGDTAGASSIVEAMMPSQSAAMAPFLGELARLSPAQKAAAVNFGDMPAAGVPGGAGTQLAARDPTPMPNPVPRPAPVFVPAPAPFGVRPAVSIAPAPSAVAIARPAPAATAPPARVYASAPLPPPAVPVVPARVAAAAPQPSAPAPAGVAAPAPQPVAPLPARIAVAALQPVPVPAAAIPAAQPAPERTVEAAPLPSEARPGFSGAVTGPSAGVFGPPPATTAPASPAPQAFATPPAAPAPVRVATVALPPATIAAPPPDRLALAEAPAAQRIVPAEPGRVGPFRTVAKKDVDEQRTQLSAETPAVRPVRTGGTAEASRGEDGASSRAGAAKAVAGKHSAAATPPVKERSTAKDDDDAAPSRRASHGARIATNDEDAKPARSGPARAKAADRDGADAAPAKGRSAEAGAGKTPDDDDAASSKAKAKAKRGKAPDDDDAKPAAKKGMSGDPDHDDTPASAGRVYVQVAGGANKDDLPKAWSQVKGKAPELLKGRTPSTTPLRFTNRLLVGPFKDEDEAQGFVNRLAGKGMPSTVFKSAKGQKIEKVPAPK